MSIERMRAALVERILSGPGEASQEERRAAFEGAPGTRASAFAERVVRDPGGVTDADFDALRAAGVGEDAAFELVVCAAVGEAKRQLDLGLSALREALRKT